MGSLRVGHDWATSLSLFTFMHWRRKWQPTPVFLPGESQGQEAWWAAVYGVAQSRTRLKRLSSSSSSSFDKELSSRGCERAVLLPVLWLDCRKKEESNQEKTLIYDRKAKLPCLFSADFCWWSLVTSSWHLRQNQNSDRKGKASIAGRKQVAAITSLDADE